MKKDLTEIVVVLDRSGSMVPIRKDMEGGFDTLIKDQQKLPGTARVTLVQFDDHIETVYSSRPLPEVPPLCLVPRGGTALLDAVGLTIDATGKRLDALPDAERPERVIFIIITDGYENASRIYSRAAIFDRISHQRSKYSWEFVYLGANQDAFAAAQGMGISIAQNFAADAAGTKAVYQSTSGSLRNYRGGQGFS